MKRLRKYLQKQRMRRKFRQTFPLRSKKGVCQRSGLCCSNLLQLSKEEIERIRERIRHQDIEPEEKHIVETRPGVFVESCPFLDSNDGAFEQTTCRIHDIRPAVCRAFICDDKIMIERYLKGEDHNPEAIGLVDLRKTFFLCAPINKIPLNDCQAAQ